MTLTIGLRFDHRDASRLRDLARRVRLQELPGDAATFEQAARAAQQREPLVVHCTDPTEVHVMAALYTRLGVTTPTVEPLGPARTPGG